MASQDCEPRSNFWPGRSKDGLPDPRGKSTVATTVSPSRAKLTCYTRAPPASHRKVCPPRVGRFQSISVLVWRTNPWNKSPYCPPPFSQRCKPTQEERDQKEKHPFFAQSHSTEFHLCHFMRHCLQWNKVSVAVIPLATEVRWTCLSVWFFSLLSFSLKVFPSSPALKLHSWN